jgi:hypothetical protein
MVEFAELHDVTALYTSQTAINCSVKIPGGLRRIIQPPAQPHALEIYPFTDLT